MKRSQLIRFTVSICTILVLNGFAIAADQCLTCHTSNGDEPSAQFKHDVHHAKGITCAGCHGGNPNAADMDQAMSKDAGFIGVPKGDQISERCASCHADSVKMKSFGAAIPTNQWQLLQASVHGRSSVKGTEHIAQCATCHNAHGILPVRDPQSPVYPTNVVRTCTKCHADPAFMRQYNPSLPVDQLEKYRTSIHGQRNGKGDPKTAECATCHGTHGVLSAKDPKSQVYPVNVPATCAKCHANAEYMKAYGIPTDQFEKYSKSVHGVALLQKHDVGAPACNSCHGNHGATPPGVTSVANVCGTCHAMNAELFDKSPHKAVFDEQGLPECGTCHGNHDIIQATDRLLGVTPEAVCSQCHSEGDSGYAVAANMRRLTDSLESSIALANTLLNDAVQKGMEVSEAEFKLRDARQARLQSRTMVHSFNEQKFDEIAKHGLVIATGVVDEGRDAVHEYYFRRWGLGIATLIITILAISLYLYIRRIERRQQGINKPTPIT